MNLSYWTEIDWVAWNRRRTSGVCVEDVKAETVVFIEEDFELVETNLNVDEEAINLRKKERKNKSLRSLLGRTSI